MGLADNRWHRNGHVSVCPLPPRATNEAPWPSYQRKERKQKPQAGSQKKTESEKSSVARLPEARVLYVIDGDTVVVRKQKQEKRAKVRLASIDCPEDGQPWGETAKYGLVKLIGGRSVKMEEHGTDLYGRTVATLYVRTGESNWLNVNERMVVLGHAWVMRAYCGHLSSEQTRRLINGETWAKTRKVGLWKMPRPIPPWQWRRESVVEQSR